MKFIQLAPYVGLSPFCIVNLRDISSILTSEENPDQIEICVRNDFKDGGKTFDLIVELPFELWRQKKKAVKPLYPTDLTFDSIISNEQRGRVSTLWPDVHFAYELYGVSVIVYGNNVTSITKTSIKEKYEQLLQHNKELKLCH